MLNGSGHLRGLIRSWPWSQRGWKRTQIILTVQSSMILSLWCDGETRDWGWSNYFICLDLKPRPQAQVSSWAQSNKYGSPSYDYLTALITAKSWPYGLSLQQMPFFYDKFRTYKPPALLISSAIMPKLSKNLCRLYFGCLRFRLALTAWQQK